MANEATKLTIGGVQHDIMDAEARRLIALLQAALDAMTGTDTTTAIETFQEVLDFLAGVTDDETLVGKITALQTAINGKVDKESGKGLSTNDFTTEEKQKLAGLSNYNDSALQTAVNNLQTALANVYTKVQTDAAIQYAVDGLGGGSVESVTINGVNHTPVNGIVDLGNINGGETVVASVDDIDIVDNPNGQNADTILAAASARMVKEIYLNVKALYQNLAGIAFVDEKPTWQAVAKRKYNLTMTALTGCTGEVVSGDAGNGQVYEGGVRIKLTPTQASYAFTSVTVNGESVDTTSADDGLGSVYLDIIVNGNITVASTAISGRGITFNGDGCSIGAAGVAIGQDLDTTITANEHFTLPASITVKIGNANVPHTYTRAQDNKTATLHIDAANITGDLTITCTAVEDAYVTIAISGSNFVVKQGNNTLTNGSKVYNGSAAQTLSIEPASGCKFSTLPSADKGTMTNNGYYEASSLVIGTSLSGTLTISAQGAALSSCNVVLPNEANISASLTDLNGNALTTPVTEGSAVRITLAPIGDVNISISSATMVGTGNLTFSDNNGTKSVEIAHVTGDISVAAAVAVAHRVANHFINMASTGDGYVEDGDDYTAVLSPTTGATSNGDLRVFVDGTPLETTDYTFDSATGALTIPAAKITGDVDVCATASTGKITVTVKAGMSTTVEFKKDQWSAAFYSDTIDASESAEDVTVVIDTVPKVNGIPIVSMWTFGTPAAIKSIDFGGCKTGSSGNKSGFSSGLSNAESITGLAFVETPNNAAVQLPGFKDCSALSGKLDLMTWRCDTLVSTSSVNNCTADEIIKPYMPNLTQLYASLAGCKVKRVIFNKTGVITQFRQLFGGATGLEYVDMSRCPVHIGTGTYDWYIVENDTTNTFTLKIGVFEMDINPSNGLTHVGKLICTTTTPPGAAILGALSANVQIYVPNNAVDAYKTAWASKASNIHPVSEYTE